MGQIGGAEAQKSPSPPPHLVDWRQTGICSRRLSTTEGCSVSHHECDPGKVNSAAAQALDARRHAARSCLVSGAGAYWHLGWRGSRNEIATRQEHDGWVREVTVIQAAPRAHCRNAIPYGPSGTTLSTARMWTSHSSPKRIRVGNAHQSVIIRNGFACGTGARATISLTTRSKTVTPASRTIMESAAPSQQDCAISQVRRSWFQPNLQEAGQPGVAPGSPDHHYAT